MGLQETSPSSSPTSERSDVDPEKAHAIPAPGQNDQDKFVVGYDGDDDPVNPKNKKNKHKWAIVLILSLGSFCVTCASSLYTTTYAGMSKDFGSSRLVNTLGLSTFVFGLGFSPMLLGPLSEFYGRRIIYLVAFGGFFIWLIPCAVAQNIATMLVARFFDGFCGSAFLSVAGGTVGDMFSKEDLQAPMLIYSASPFLGPATAPVWGSTLNWNIDWRWSYYVLLIYAGIEWVLIFFFVPETYMPVVLRRKAQKKRKETGDERWKAPIEISDKSVTSTVLRSLYRPFLLLFLEPMCFNICLFSAILLGILYLFFGAFPLVFGQVYGFNLWQNGLSFLGIFVGMVSAILMDPILSKNYRRLLDKKEKETGERISEPEFRLPGSIFGAWFCVIGLFWFGWTIVSASWEHLPCIH